MATINRNISKGMEDLVRQLEFIQDEISNSPKSIDSGFALYLLGLLDNSKKWTNEVREAYRESHPEEIQSDSEELSL